MFDTIKRGLGLAAACEIDHDEMAKLPTFYDLPLPGFLDSNTPEVSMSDLRGKVLLVTNTASKCGLTKAHLSQLKTLHEEFKDKGFVVLAFPCAQFANQEHSDSCKIRDRMLQDKITFPVFSPVEVNGSKSNLIFKWLKYYSCQFGASPENKSTKAVSDIGWNFGKFLVDKNGKVKSYHGPKTDPSSMRTEIEGMLAQ